MRQSIFHQPVLAKAAVDFLITKSDGIYVDCTTGGGGHSELILQHLDARGTLLGLDADADAIVSAGKRLETYPNKKLKQSNFEQLDVHLMAENLVPVNGILFDLGISSFQIDNAGKGFSFQSEGPLDMRFNRDQELTAREVVNQYSRQRLEAIFRDFGEERYWRSIAAKIAAQRVIQPFETTSDLVEAIQCAVSHRFLNKTLARIFQAIRIEVNRELERLEQTLHKAFSVLADSGRMVIISYHSLEDRIVKEFFRHKALPCVCPPDFPTCVCEKKREMRILTRKPVQPTDTEIRENPRSRSARLRAAEKIVPFGGAG